MIDEILEAAVSLTTKDPKEFLATLKSENGDWKPEAAGMMKQQLTSHLEKTVTEQSGRKVRERMTSAEKVIKPIAEKHGLQWGETLEDNLKSLIETIESKGGKETVITKEAEITEELISKHPVFTRLVGAEVQKATQKVETEKQGILNEFQGFKAKLESDKVKTAVSQRAEETLVRLKSKLSDDPARKKAQIDTFVTALSASQSFKLDEKGEPYPVDANGEALTENYLPITFADLVSARNIFETHAFDPNKGGAGANTPPPNGGARFTGAVPKTNAEFQAAMRTEKDPAKKAALLDAYEKSFTASK